MEHVNRIPSQIQRGDTFRFRVSSSQYAAPEWSVVLYLRKASDPVITLPLLSYAGDHFLSSSISYESGEYQYQVKARNGDVVETLLMGSVTVLPDLLQDSAQSSASAAKIIAVIDKVIQGNIEEGFSEYQHNGKRIVNMSLPDLLKTRSYYQKLMSSSPVTGDLLNSTPKKSFVRKIKHRMP